MLNKDFKSACLSKDCHPCPRRLEVTKMMTKSVLWDFPCLGGWRVFLIKPQWSEERNPIFKRDISESNTPCVRDDCPVLVKPFL